jgi:hypothetical protein
MPRKQPAWWYLANRLKFVHKMTDTAIAETLGVHRSAIRMATDPKYRVKRRRQSQRDYVRRQLQLAEQERIRS